MRTAMPLETCSRITLRSPSASSLSISTPRLIGPGCMMMALGLSHEARVLLRPNMLVYSPREGKWPVALALVLDAQKHDDFGVGERRLQVVRDRAPRRP